MRSATRSPRTSPRVNPSQASRYSSAATSPAAWLISWVVRQATSITPCGWIDPGIWIGSRAHSSRLRVSDIRRRFAQVMFGGPEPGHGARDQRLRLHWRLADLFHDAQERTPPLADPLAIGDEEIEAREV